jgi:hypothetical protein
LAFVWVGDQKVCNVLEYVGAIFGIVLSLLVFRIFSAYIGSILTLAVIEGRIMTTLIPGTLVRPYPGVHVIVLVGAFMNALRFAVFAEAVIVKSIIVAIDVDDTPGPKLLGYRFNDSVELVN